ncbi:MAG: class I SAM-dependent methyltransferase [Candidatus Bathyarchaeota archaeon]|nr:class I SAM-dependent methyltransferase [Candidatus Bathyarchaeota archaeon]
MYPLHVPHAAILDFSMIRTSAVQASDAYVVRNKFRKLFSYLMSNFSAFESYIKNTSLRKLLEELGASDIDMVVKAVEHFTDEEGEKRDKIVFDYFGEDGVNQVVASIVELLLSPPELPADANILDVGAGSGFFTVKVAEEVHRHLPEASFYGMDVTPTMLSALARKPCEITPFLGIAENIAGSVEYARRYLEIPVKFDGLFSTLMLHHCPDPKRVLKSFREALDDCGKAILIDLCEHPF